MSTLGIIDALPSGLGDFSLDPVDTFTSHTRERDDLKNRKDNVMGWLVEIAPEEVRCICAAEESSTHSITMGCDEIIFLLKFFNFFFGLRYY